MSQNYNSISEILAYFMKLQKYATAVLVKINEAVSTDSDTVILPIENDSGVVINYKIPSFKSLERRITEVDRQFKSMYFKDDNKTIDGKGLVIEPPMIKDADVPIEFFSKPNYIFENLLNPLLYIKVDVSKYVSPSSTHIIARRMLLNIDTEDKRQYFINYLNKNKNIDYDDVQHKLITEGIQYTFDEEILMLPPIRLKYNGSFGVVRIGTEISTENDYSTIREYIFDTITYNQINTDGSTTKTLLKKGDLLILSDKQTFYKILSVNQDTLGVTLGLESGYDVVPIGTDVIKIATPLVGEKYFHISIGVNEYQIIFLKPIDETNHTTTEKYSMGFAFKTEDLYIQTPEGRLLFDKFYTEQVNDFSKLFLGLSKEQTIPSIFVIKPDPPTLNSDNFKVHILNEQTNDPDTLSRQKGLVEKREILEEKKELVTGEINTTQKTLQEDRTLSPDDRIALGQVITEKIAEKGTIIQDLVVVKQDIIQESQNILEKDLPKPKTVIDGAWMPPVSKISEVTGVQHPTHFNIKVTYLDKFGNTPQNVLINIKKENGTIEPCYVPNFKIYETPRRRLIKDIYGNYIPEPLNLSDPLSKAITQLPVPIPIDVASGEQVQIQVQTCVETAGLPTADSFSEWSEPIIIKVPEELRPPLNQQTILHDKIKYYANIDKRDMELDQLTLNQDKMAAQVALLNSLINNTTTTYQPIAPFIISPIDLANKFILLPFMPFSYSSILVFLGPTRLIHGIDYLLMGNRIDWGGMGLDGTITEGAVLEVVNLGAQSNVNVSLSV